MFAWPPGSVTLNFFYTKESAQEYIDNYPNIFYRQFLKIEEDLLIIQDTD